MHSWMQARSEVLVDRLMMRSRKTKKTSRRLPLYVLNRYINMFFMIGVTWFLLRFLECSSKSTWYVVLVVARFPMSLNKASACFSVNTLNCAQGFFLAPLPLRAEGGPRLLEDGICLNKNVKQVTEVAWIGGTFLLTCYLHWTHT